MTPPDPIRRVLVVDDSLLMRTVVLAQLAAEGHELRAVADGRQALEAVAEEVPDVILLDVEMPVMDGLAVLERLQADPVHREVPVILLSGRTDADDVANGLRLGAHDYLRKPFAEVELVARVRAAMRTRVLQDALRARNLELVQLAATDVLTGLRNRGWLEEQAARTFARLRRHGGAVSVLLVDVDHFKAVNDVHGHAMGDRVLMGVARALAGAVREEDLLARWGGEEFLVVAADTVPTGAHVLAERLRAAVAAVMPEGPGAPTVTASVGWTTATPAQEGAPAWHELVAAADERLYQAKEAGRDCARGGIVGVPGPMSGPVGSAPMEAPDHRPGSA